MRGTSLSWTATAVLWAASERPAVVRKLPADLRDALVANGAAFDHLLG